MKDVLIAGVSPCRSVDEHLSGMRGLLVVDIRLRGRHFLSSFWFYDICFVGLCRAQILGSKPNLGKDILVVHRRNH